MTTVLHALAYWTAFSLAATGFYILVIEVGIALKRRRQRVFLVRHQGKVNL